MSKWYQRSTSPLVCSWLQLVHTFTHAHTQPYIGDHDGDVELIHHATTIQYCLLQLSSWVKDWKELNVSLCHGVCWKLITYYEVNITDEGVCVHLLVYSCHHILRNEHCCWWCVLSFTSLTIMYCDVNMCWWGRVRSFTCTYAIKYTSKRTCADKIVLVLSCVCLKLLSLELFNVYFHLPTKGGWIIWCWADCDFAPLVYASTYWLVWCLDNLHCVHSISFQMCYRFVLLYSSMLYLRRIHTHGNGSHWHSSSSKVFDAMR